MNPLYSLNFVKGVQIIAATRTSWASWSQGGMGAQEKENHCPQKVSDAPSSLDIKILSVPPKERMCFWFNFRGLARFRSRLWRVRAHSLLKENVLSDTGGL